MTELDTAHVGKPIVTPKDSLTLSNSEMMEKRHGVYVVKLGDNLYAISRKLGVDFHELKKKNKLKSNIVHVGQELKY
jgi:LysM repeat protein